MKTANVATIAGIIVLLLVGCWYWCQARMVVADPIEETAPHFPIYLEHPAQSQHIAYKGLCQTPPSTSSDCINRKMLSGIDLQHALATCITPGAVSERCMSDRISEVYQGNPTTLAMEEYITRHGETLRK